ncbi:MAG: outer membrane beta-barrel protein [Acidobacteria bacterium]|nr:outer membrane beta-barrel protein [Acidobacteriota bacterium]
MRVRVPVALITLTLTLTLSALSAAPALAQSDDDGVGVGVLGGITRTTVQPEENPFSFNTDGGGGWMAGIWFGGNRNGRVGVMGEANWVVKKFTVDESEQELRYVEIPVLLRVNAGSLDRNKPSLYLIGGPVFDIQVKAIEDGESVDDVYEGLDIGAMAGVGFEAARIGIEGRYSWGLRSVLATDAALAAGFGTTRLNTLQVLLKIRFN